MSKSLEDSQRFIYKILPQANGIGFAVHRPFTASTALTEQVLKEASVDWEFIGIVTLLPQESVLPIPPTSEDLNRIQSTSPDEGRGPPDIETLQLGYLFLPEFWGKGYGTESATAILSHYRDFKASIGDSRPTYIEAVVHGANIGSTRVMERLQFPIVGIKVWGDELIMLGGELRENRTNIYGMYL
jgi:RimJ/RimL family protein N-acetyltransferase